MNHRNRIKHCPLCESESIDGDSVITCEDCGSEFTSTGRLIYTPEEPVEEYMPDEKFIQEVSIADIERICGSNLIKYGEKDTINTTQIPWEYVGKYSLFSIDVRRVYKFNSSASIWSFRIYSQGSGYSDYGYESVVIALHEAIKVAKKWIDDLDKQIDNETKEK